MIKKSLGKLDCPDDLDACVKEFEFQWLPIELKHIRQLNHLPMHHRDLFDRLLLCQCQSEGLCLLTRDEWMSPYQEVKQLKE